MKFDMSAAWNEATRLIAANRDVVLIVAGVFFFLPYAVLTMLMGDQMAAIEASAGSGADPDAAMSAMMSFYAGIWWVLLLVSLVQWLGMLALLALLGDRSRPTVGEALKIGLKMLVFFIVAQILVGLALTLLVALPFVVAAAGSVGLAVIVGIAAFVALIYLFTKFSLVAPVMVIDGVANPFTALGRSWRLTKGNSLRLWLFYFLLIVAIAVVGIVLSIVIGLVFALAGPQTAVIGNALVASLLNAAWATLFLAALAAAHRQLAGDRPETAGETLA